MMRVAFGGRGQVGNSADAGRRQFGKTRPRGPAGRPKGLLACGDFVPKIYASLTVLRDEEARRSLSRDVPHGSEPRRPHS